MVTLVTPREAVLRGRRGDAVRVWWDAFRVHRRGQAAVHDRQRQRLADLVAFAREHSAFYRELYRGLPQGIDDVTLLPVTDKRQLMARFDDVPTDPAVTRSAVEDFVADPARIGKRFAGKYLVATTAGTTGARGLFVLDDRYWAVTSGLMGTLGAEWLSPAQLLQLAVRGGQFAGVIATGGHFLSVSAGTRERRENPWRHRRLRIFPVDRPLPQLVAGLNLVQPVLLGSYASVLRLLSTEQESGRLHLHPKLVLSTAEAFRGQNARALSGPSGHPCARFMAVPSPATPPRAAGRAGSTSLKTG
ncbi:hypothetical protein [Pseudarthrobacter sp. C4D7]|uniref:hypothetical protein n=1 Tax=Pseudarthrobacter sp. C4D7 TaxID=2735268 RepID=UPI0020C77ED2|nr:hypothetical protein [Pseudarthrobacter sp. C4D7]